MIKVFSSGSCRLVMTIGDGRGKIEPIHSMFYPVVGINFLGKFNNTKQHIQFIKWFSDQIELPQNILTAFLTPCSNVHYARDKELVPSRKENIKNAFNQCDYYMFEICSLKLNLKDGYQVHFEHTNDYELILQTETDLYNDLKILQELIPKGKKIIFQTHFRPNIIYDNDSMAVKNREIIYNVLTKFCSTNENVYLHDPSIVLKGDPSLFDGDGHFAEMGYQTNFNYIYDNFIQKLGV